MQSGLGMLPRIVLSDWPVHCPECEHCTAPRHFTAAPTPQLDGGELDEVPRRLSPSLSMRSSA
jgi:hypothetical protein